MRAGTMNRSDFGERMNGHGPRWNAVLQMFEITCRRLELNVDDGVDPPVDVAPTFKQGDLFAGG